ncbi:RING finger protein 112-like isoform X2 [Hyla sarda]|uniref:RING finger protein 112-like isoform X2 n=1 Tax=Hyla sarda TaxID=327740 RepID=UPI0024C349C8|nr:RING finger protein 112-like isoform X2 [Hyla sarda]
MEERRRRSDQRGAEGPPRRRPKRKPRREQVPTACESAPSVRFHPHRFLSFPSNDTLLPPDGAVSFQTLVEDITCSVCLDDLQNPVSIACGHTFCRNCITTHWRTPQPEGYLCPECRTQCPRYQIAPDYRLMNLIDKIQKGMQEKTSEKSPRFPEKGFPVQLVWTDGNGCLHLDESVVDDCFMRSDLSGYPVYLLCVIGEKRRGKSFLMNYIIRALESQEKGEEFSLGADDEPLQGFEWRCGIDSTTKGIWIWNRPFILGHKGEQVAVYILDTEGSLDIEGDRESCIKLSALSMLLSSHLVFNVAGSLKETELDYMEMYLHMGEEFGPQRLQYLDILIRDWHDSSNCGRDAARFYISREIEKGRSYPKVLWGLKSSHTRCFLLPHPGKGITRESLGRLQDMDQDFQDNLRSYVEDIMRGVWHRTKTDIAGQMLTSSQIPTMLQVFVGDLERQKYGFSTPMEMFYAIKNQKILEGAKEELQDFLKNQPYHLLPSTMRTLVSDKTAELSAKFKDSLLGPNLSHHSEMQKELESHLLEEQEKFCSGYTTRFTCNAVTIGVTAGLGIYGVVGAAAARGTVVLATQPVVAVAEKTAVETGLAVATSTIGLLKTGASAIMGRFFRL